MGRAQLLKWLNVVLSLSLILQITACSGMFFEWSFFPKGLLFKVHLFNGVFLFVMALVHIYLHWNWIWATYFKMRPAR